jgi:hypothetical protein
MILNGQNEMEKQWNFNGFEGIEFIHEITICFKIVVKIIPELHIKAIFKSSDYSFDIYQLFLCPPIIRNTYLP